MLLRFGILLLRWLLLHHALASSATTLLLSGSGGVFLGADFQGLSLALFEIIDGLGRRLRIFLALVDECVDFGLI